MHQEIMKDIGKEKLWVDGFKFGIFQFDSEEAKKGSCHKTHKFHEGTTMKWN